jgi:arsenate reductase
MANALFLQYPKCTTCRNAKKWLEARGVEFEDRHIAEHPPTKDELREVLKKSGLDIKKLFNTSGQKYRELGLKDKLKEMSEEEMLDLLASDGMLVKRPILVHGDKATVGFKEAEYEKVLG